MERWEARNLVRDLNYYVDIIRVNIDFNYHGTRQILVECIPKPFMAEAIGMVGHMVFDSGSSRRQLVGEVVDLDAALARILDGGTAERERRDQRVKRIRARARRRVVTRADHAR